MAIDRSAVAQALAKAIAYKACGQDLKALEWARKLVHLLECAESAPWTDETAWQDAPMMLGAEDASTACPF